MLNTEKNIKKYKLEGESLLKEINAFLPKGIDCDLAYYKFFCNILPKNYIRVTEDNKIKMSGVSFRSRGIEKFGKDFIRDSIWDILNKEYDKIRERYLTLRELIMSGKMELNEFIQHREINRSLNAYQANKIKSDQVYEVLLAKNKNVPIGNKVGYYFAKPTEKKKICKLKEDYAEDYDIEYLLERLKAFTDRIKPLLSDDLFYTLFSKPQDEIDNKDYMYKEVCFSYMNSENEKKWSKWLRLKTNQIPHFVREHSGSELYMSVQKFRNAEKVYGEDFLMPLFFDLDVDDVDDLSQAQAEAIYILDELFRLNIPDNMIHLSFSGCYSKDTEILTQNGWKYFKDLQTTDKVAVKHKNTTKYEYPQTIQKFPYKGHLYNLKSSFIDILVTPDHNMYHQIQKDNKKEFELRPIKELINRSNLIFNRGIEHTGKEQKYFVLPETYKICGGGKIKYKIPAKKIKMDDWLEFLGYWLSEGYSRKRKSKRGKNAGSCEITICQKDTKNFKKIWNSAKRIFGSKVKYSKHPNGCNYLMIYDKQLCNVLCKKIDRNILNLSKRQLKILFDAFYLGDGDKNKNVLYPGIQKELADNINELCLRLGYASNVTKDGNMWLVTYNKSTKHQYNIKNTLGTGWGYGLVPYNDNVYCCEVSTGVIFVRRNGKPMWCGNSKGFHIIVDEAVFGFKPSSDLHKKIEHIHNKLRTKFKLQTLCNATGNRKMLRIQNTPNMKSGLFKITIPIKMIGEDITNILALAVSPKKKEKIGVASKIDVAEKWANDMLRDYKTKEYKRTTLKIVPDYVPVCVKDLLENGIKVKGSRNRATLVLAGYYKDQEVSEEDCVELLTKWTQNIDPKLTSTRNGNLLLGLESCVKTVYSGDAYHFACPFIKSLGWKIKCSDKCKLKGGK